MGEQLTFEEAMKRMEDIVCQLEDGDLPLTQSLELFEEGVRLYKYCVQKLEEAEGRISVILQDSEGNIQKLKQDMEGN